MIIAPRYGFVFLCMTKCASTSTERILRPYGDIVTGSSPYYKHMTYMRYKRFLEPLLRLEMKGKNEKIEVVCLFREPVDWLHSWYRYRKRESLQHGLASENSTAGVSFEEFAQEYVSETPRPFARVGRQFNMVRNGKGHLGNIKLFRYEDYDAFLDYLSGKIGKRLQAPILNQSPPPVSALPDLPFLTDYLREEYNVYSRIER